MRNIVFTSEATEDHGKTVYTINEKETPDGSLYQEVTIQEHNREGAGYVQRYFRMKHVSFLDRHMKTLMSFVESEE